MSTTITIDPRELMDTAVLLGSSAVELADLGSTLRSCTACAMPPEVRNGVDALVAVADRIFDDMAVQLRSEAANLAQRAIIAANDMLTAAGYPPLPGTNVTTAAGPDVASGVSVIGGNTGPGFAITDPGGSPVVTPSTMTLGGNSWGTLTTTHPDGSPVVTSSTMTLGGNSWGAPVILGTGGSTSSVGGLVSRRCIY